MELLTRKEARAQGLKQYYTGRPCPAGHVFNKLVSSKRCVLCARGKNKRYRAKHRERLQERCKQWKQQNRQRANEINKNSYYRVGRTKAAYYKEWRIKNPELYKAITRRRRAAKIGAAGRHTADDIKKLFKQQRGVCLCGVKLFRYHVDHKNPLSRGGSDWPRNLQLLCQPCNDSKGTRTMREWKVCKRAKV